MSLYMYGIVMSVISKKWQVSGEYLMASKSVLLTKCYQSRHQKNR